MCVLFSSSFSLSPEREIPYSRLSFSIRFVHFSIVGPFTFLPLVSFVSFAFRVTFSVSASVSIKSSQQYVNNTLIAIQKLNISLDV